MIAVDTNFLLRLTLKDEMSQAARAVTLIEKTLAERQAALINPVVLCEYVWTLARTYKANRKELADAVRQYLDRPPYKLFDEAAVIHALALFEAGKADFADCLIGAMNQAARANVTYSFDSLAAGLDAVALPPK